MVVFLINDVLLISSTVFGILTILYPEFKDNAFFGNIQVYVAVIVLSVFPVKLRELYDKRFK